MAKDLSNSYVRAIWDKTGGHCWYCGVQLELYDPKQPRLGQRYCMEIDHMVPVSRGGLTVQSNLVPSCPRCNSEKNDRTVEEYRADITRHLNGVPKFRGKQVEWLLANGFSFPHYPPHQFWAEKVKNGR